jgi:hypothetical protein
MSKLLAGAAGGDRVWLLHVDVEVQVDMPFQIVSGHGRGGTREFMNDMDRPDFLERELVELAMDGEGRSELTTYASGSVSNYTFQKHLMRFSNEKMHYIFTLELVH